MSHTYADPEDMHDKKEQNKKEEVKAAKILHVQTHNMLVCS